MPVEGTQPKRWLRAWWQQRTLTLRLTLVFVLLSGLTIAGLTALFMWATSVHFRELDSQTLQDKQRLVTQIITHANSVEDLSWRLQETLANHHGLFVRVQSDRGLVFQNPANPPTRSLGQQFVVQGYAVQLLLDTAHHDDFWLQMMRQLSWYALLAVSCSAFFAWLAARFGLAPLKAMRLRMQDIHGQRLQPRMPTADLPPEIATLAHTMNHMLARLQQDFQRLLDFSSELAHELRTPLSNMLMQTEVTLSQARDGARYQAALQSNAEELQHLSQMVADMLYLAKTETMHDLPAREAVDLAHVVTGLCQFYEASVLDKGLLLLWDALSTSDTATQPPCIIAGNAAMLRRAVSNLLSNAVRHTPRQGQIHITVVHSPDKQITLTVANTGEPIAAADQARIFDRFYRCASAPTLADENTESLGLGLGLAITKATVTAHQGTITLQCDHGWTRFICQFKGLSPDPRAAPKTPE